MNETSPDSTNEQTGWPSIELGGRNYVVRFTMSGLAYRLSRSGVTASDILSAKSFSVLVDILHAGISPQFGGNPEDLAAIVYGDEDKLKAMGVVLGIALKKLSLSGDAPAATESTAAESKPKKPIVH